MKESGLEPAEDKSEAVSNVSLKLRTFRQMLDDAFFDEMVDILYFWLGVFTYVYFFTIALLYFGSIPYTQTVSSKIISALAEPYLGAVGIYTILKETRKRKRRLSPRHWGELFVGGWLALLLSASFLAFFFDVYTLNNILEDIITISLAVAIIYVGGSVHKP